MSQNEGKLRHSQMNENKENLSPIYLYWKEANENSFSRNEMKKDPETSRRKKKHWKVKTWLNIIDFPWVF